MIEGSPRDPTEGVPSTVFRYDQMTEVFCVLKIEANLGSSFLLSLKIVLQAQASLMVLLHRLSPTLLLSPAN